MTAINANILFNDVGGSDTQASGVGPATAVFGTGASTNNTTTVDLTADTPDLSGVSAGDLMWVDSSSGRQFSVISSVDDGADTVTCDDTYTQTEGSRNWGIGGKRNNIGNANSVKLFTADAKPAWTIELEDDQTISAQISQATAGDATDVIRLIGSSGAIRTITMDADARHFVPGIGGALWRYENLKFDNSNGTKTAAQAFRLNTSGGFEFINCEFGDVTNTLLNAIVPNASSCAIAVINCHLHHCTGDAITNRTTLRLFIHGCAIHDNTLNGVEFSGDNMVISHSVIYDNGGDGINITATGDWYVSHCTIHSNSGDGIECSTEDDADRSVCFNNNLTGNTGYGIRGPVAHAERFLFDFNNFGTGATANTAGASLNIAVGAGSLSVDPGHAATYPIPQIDDRQVDFKWTSDRILATGCP